MEREIILKLILENRLKEARKELMRLNVVDVASLLDEIDDDKFLIKVFRLLPKETSAEVFAYLSGERQENIIRSIADVEVSYIVEELFIDDAVDFIEEMPANVVKRVLKNTSEDRRAIINQFLQYSPDSAGSLMTIEYADLKRSMTIFDAMQRIRNTGYDRETIDTCYVTDANRVLEGTITLRKLILSNPEQIVQDLMNKTVISVHTSDDQEKVARDFRKYSLFNMPVVDNENRLVGIITVDDVVGVIDEENTEDIQKMAAIQPFEEEYLETGVLKLARNRVVWLMVLMFSATFTGMIIRGFNISNVLLSSFIPMLMNTAGNAGSQSAVLVIRSMALDQVHFRDIFRVQWIELRVAFIAGAALALGNFARVTLLDRLPIMVAVTICVSIFVTVVLAKIVGGTLPILAKRCNLDPAMMASPLITTMVDALSLMVFFSLAQRLVPELCF